MITGSGMIYTLCPQGFSVINMSDSVSAMSSSLWELDNTLNALIYIYQIPCSSYVILEYIYIDWTDSPNIVFLSLVCKENSIPALMEVLSPR